MFNEEYIGNDRIIDAHVKNLRKKLPMNLIKTVIGVGYQYALPGEKYGRN
ncbi:MAG: helix-turn-helix domain-containing protein [[Clostridium] scindens]